MHQHGLVAIALILFAGIVCQWIAWRVRIPAILFLLLCGIAAGPLLGWLQPDQVFGDLLFPFISLAVAVILFEGGLTLKFHDIRGLEKVIRNLITFGVAITWLITALAVRWLLDFSWELSFLFGAIMVVTGPTVILPMLRTVRPKQNVANILRWEGILIDPIGATLAVLVYQFIASDASQGQFLARIAVFGKILAIGSLMGSAGGFLLGSALRRHWIPQYLRSFSALALVCAVFAASDLLEAESGLLTVTVMGIFLANMRDVNLDEILDFKESLSVVLISMLFILLAARMNWQEFLALGWSSVAVFAVIQFLSRPITAQAAAWGSSLTMAERHLLSWIAPRGIVAAAISAVFAIRLEDLGYVEAAQMVPLSFTVIIGTVLLQSVTAGPIARALKVAEPEPKGFLILGADQVARAIAAALKKNGFRVVLADQNWEDIRTANMDGIQTYWGNAVSIHADRQLDLTGVGKLMALTANSDFNALAAKHYRAEFGEDQIYVIRVHQQKKTSNAEKTSIRAGGTPLFGESLTRDELFYFIVNGAEIKTTELTDRFSYEDYMKPNEVRRIPLFVIDPADRIHPVTDARKVTPDTGWKVTGLVVKRALWGIDVNHVVGDAEASQEGNANTELPR
jgi:NhaP-type Na+/H+ or K+/H+ antiporter